MPRPSEGYRNAAGQPVPGCSDITKRFMDRSRLLYWAFNRGKQGFAKLYDDAALDIGTAVHMMAELDLKGQTEADIDFYLNTTLRDADQRAKAKHAFGAFRKWREANQVEVVAQEISLVSEKLQFGGTLDNVALLGVQRRRRLIDLKTSASGEIYEDHVLQLAGYDILWNETHPDEPLDGVDLIVLPKDGSDPVHAAFTREQLHPFRQKFWLYRQAFGYDAICNDPKVLRGGIVKPNKRAAKAAAPKSSPKPAEKITVHAPASRGMTMGELLMAYGHVQAPEGVRA
jgi:hypothetical protein